MILEGDAKFYFIYFFFFFVMQNLKKKVTCDLENNMKNLANLKIGTLTGYFYPKQKMCELKMYRGVICYDNEERCKI